MFRRSWGKGTTCAIRGYSIAHSFNLESSLRLTFAVTKNKKTKSLISSCAVDFKAHVM